MFRRVLVFVAVVGLAVALTPEPVVADGGALHLRFAEKGAQAGWTTCRIQPEPDAVCTDTFVFVAEQVVKEDGTEGTTLFLSQFSYKFDREGNFIFVSRSSGYADTTLSIDQNLTSASASATVPLTICTVDPQGNFTCADGGTATVSAVWTGTGDLVRVNHNFHVGSKGYTLISHFRGKFRDASASGQVSDSDVGTQFFARMFDVREGRISVCHGVCVLPSPPPVQP